MKLGLPSKDGTYSLKEDGTFEDYAAKWSYGYIVGVKPLQGEPRVGELFGVWTDPEDGTLYVDVVEHVDALTDAIRVAVSRGEKAIYDLRDCKVIDVQP